MKKLNKMLAEHSEMTKKVLVAAMAYTVVVAGWLLIAYGIFRTAQHLIK